MRQFAPFALALSLVACNGAGPVADEANNTAGLNEVVDAANASAEAARNGSNDGFEPTGGEDPDTSAGIPIPPEEAAAAAIPAQYRGRWGLVPADCTSTRGDAKGLITIDGRTVRFYESVATLKERRPAKATSFSGLFAFTGEGEKWEKVMTFTRAGDTLLRAEENGRFTYRRC